jgi:hypothetical protein
MANAIQVEGLADLQRAFTAADRALREDLRDALQEAAAPVRADAQTLTGITISGMRKSPDWTRMRVGQSGTVVYVVPVERGAKGRANQRLRRGTRFKTMMLRRAMEPALARNRGKVIARLDHMLADVKRVWEKHG